tara:strand:- start:311 stop:454 length:144 start_codon:yes stop_codon:yes gene_type:complete
MQAIHTDKVDIDYLSKSINDACSLNEVDVHTVLIALWINVRLFFATW